ncbi:hypothetical protein DAH66_12575 [Sphingomonas koreensis]|jgi:hypothetical protein|uniref:Uncharacterized protein n=1 Tax=Sphingomonas koreensis TaxID=93064 RepID=A0A430CE63_9SPHN|nr:hypothetical protein [Sphingomonas koreensis]RSU55000.1 hypothetical protein DAH56_20765 [Sphingomonas koreensis]RSU63232.1 hypothetical protein DAH55_20795 [Sphingomonas koreensis]RSY83097.1 hypothetical protein DAH66_12575 [Sphingomonas koreensis]
MTAEIDSRWLEAFTALSDMTDRAEAAIRKRDALVRRFDALKRDRLVRSLSDLRKLAAAIVDADERIAEAFIVIHDVINDLSAITPPHEDEDCSR